MRRLVEVRLMEWNGPTPYCEWCGSRKTGRGRHGDVIKEEGGLKTICCRVELVDDVNDAIRVYGS